MNPITDGLVHTSSPIVANDTTNPNTGIDPICSEWIYQIVPLVDGISESTCATGGCDAYNLDRLWDTCPSSGRVGNWSGRRKRPAAAGVSHRWSRLEIAMHMWQYGQERL